MLSERPGPSVTVPLVSHVDYDDISNQIDFIICLGGDGTLLYASSLFQVRAVSFRAGSFLLFLSSFLC